MHRAAVLAVAVTILAAGCGDPESVSGQPLTTTVPGSLAEDVALPTVTSSWRFVSLDVDGEAVAIEQPLFLDVTDDGFNAGTTCNSVTGQFGGELIMTAMGCPGLPAEVQNYMVQALRTTPTMDSEQLAFDDGDVRLVYEAYTQPLPTDLFAVLGDPSASVDETALPAEQATGTVPPDFDTLVPVPSPSSDVDLFLAEVGGNVCLVYGTATSLNQNCQSPRYAEISSYAVDIPIYEAPIVRVALIPDRFGAAAAARPDLGAYESNIFIVSGEAPEGRHVLTDDHGDTMALIIPPPWVDPMAASRTVPEA